MDEAKRPSAILIVVGLLLLLPFLYVGSYLALVVRDRSIRINTDHEVEYDEAYRIGSSIARPVFWPLNGLDRQVRHGYWGWPSERAGEHVP